VRCAGDGVLHFESTATMPVTYARLKALGLRERSAIWVRS
jgi:hypothetical protein